MAASVPPFPRAPVDVSMWRALAVYRFLALAYALARFALSWRRYDHPVWAAAVLLGMVVWSVWSVFWYRRADFRRWMVLFDIGIAVAAVLSTTAVDSAARVAAGAITLPTVWSSAAVVAASIAFGWRGGLSAAFVVGAADFVERGSFAVNAVHNVVIMLLAGAAIGYVVEISRDAARTYVRAQRLEAATRERQRLSRDIHDGVLQVLALVQRRGAELGGEAAELGRLAGEQELALRSLVNSWHEVDLAAEAGDPVELDVCALLGRLTSSAPASGGPRVTLSGPGAPVTLPGAVAAEVAAAVAAALDNVRVHGGPGADGLGARAWILVEDEGDAVLVSVRDDGPGIPQGRLEAARRLGRLGVAQSIRGRIEDAGGRVEVTSVPGQGTEVELRIPRSPGTAAAPGPVAPAGAVPVQAGAEVRRPVP